MEKIEKVWVGFQTGFLLNAGQVRLLQALVGYNGLCVKQRLYKIIKKIRSISSHISIDSLVTN